MKLYLFAAATLLTIGLPAQETYWVANRASNDIMEITHWGSVVQRVDMSPSGSTGLRSAHVAPDGKVWVIGFFFSSVIIYDPATANVSTFAYPFGSPYFIAFDANGNGWVSGGTGVVERDPNGNPTTSGPSSNGEYALTAGSPLGITVDHQGNKWIAHRLPTGSVSRIDGQTAAITNHPVSGSNPVSVVADARGFPANFPLPAGFASHIWVTCDNGGSLLELDSNGVELNNYTMPATTIGGSGPSFDLNGDIWVGSYAVGSLFQVDETNGAVINTVSVPNNTIGVATDSLGRILASARVTFSGVGPPCEVRRVDPVTGVLEMNTLLELGGNNAAGTQSAVSTPFQYSLVVDQLGDLDGDGEVNYVEVTNGTFPTDPCSNSNLSLHTTGVTDTTNGGTANWRVHIGSGAGFIAWSLDRVAAGSGISLPGVSCEVVLDPALSLGALFVAGSASISQTIPSDPGMVGVEFVAQAIGISSTNTLSVSNLSGIKLW